MDQTRPVITEEGLRALCAEWQGILGLRDWEVHLSLKRAWDMGYGQEHVTGDVDVHPAKRQAVIRILDPADWREDSYWPYDVEVVLVHELLHIHTDGMGVRQETPEGLAEEQAIHAISQALVNLKRGGSHETVDAG